MNQKNEIEISTLLHCFSLLEQETYHFYRNLSEKIDFPHIKFLLLDMAYESLKHSKMFLAIATPMFKKVRTNKHELHETLGIIWEKCRRLTNELDITKKFDEGKLSAILKESLKFELSLIESYSNLVEEETLQTIIRKLFLLYHVNYEMLKMGLTSIVDDKKRLSNLLSSITFLMAKEALDRVKNNTPKVKYPAPYAWNR